MFFSRCVWRRCCPHVRQWRSKSAATFAKTFARISIGARSAHRCEGFQFDNLDSTRYSISIFTFLCTIVKIVPKIWNKHLPTCIKPKSWRSGISLSQSIIETAKMTRLGAKERKNGSAIKILLRRNCRIWMMWKQWFAEILHRSSWFQGQRSRTPAGCRKQKYKQCINLELWKCLCNSSRNYVRRGIRLQWVLVLDDKRDTGKAALISAQNHFEQIPR